MNDIESLPDLADPEPAPAPEPGLPVFLPDPVPAPPTPDVTPGYLGGVGSAIALLTTALAVDDPLVKFGAVIGVALIALALVALQVVSVVTRNRRVAATYAAHSAAVSSANYRV